MQQKGLSPVCMLNYLYGEGVYGTPHTTCYILILLKRSLPALDLRIYDILE